VRARIATGSPQLVEQAILRPNDRRALTDERVLERVVVEQLFELCQDGPQHAGPLRRSRSSLLQQSGHKASVS
jgi:hypothetical protein